MKYKQRTSEETNERCELLESFGFYCEHQDSRVFHSSFPSVTFDFSAINPTPDNIMYHALKVVYQTGVDDGREEIRNGLKEFLGV